MPATQPPLPLLPTSVIGSHGLPGWVYSALESIDAGRFGPTDERELLDDAVNLASRDQERAGVDIISDGEMRRWKFVQSFYRRMTGLQPQGPLRKLGPEGYDSVPRYQAVERVKAPHGLGIVDEFTYARRQAVHRIKATCPGPVTISIHIRERPSVYKDRLELASEFVDVINAELRALVDAGADYIQIDEPSHSIIGGSARDYVDLFNRTVKGVNARIALHICFGNLASRARFERTYAPLFPSIMDANAQELVFEFANRELREVDLCARIAEKFDVGAGLVDVKSYFQEPPELIATRIREVLKHAPAKKVRVVPDCGFFTVPRWLCVSKLTNMVAGTRIVRDELASPKRS
ncbi:MAG: cobalamin-independent methionine synthase II family protein [Chloroflexi bacterium]|nr:cobalamin-independent methionine synthase II family protein [Chloroflexota bacterium]